MTSFATTKHKKRIRESSHDDDDDDVAPSFEGLLDRLNALLSDRNDATITRDEPADTARDVYHRFLNSPPNGAADDLSATRHGSNLSSWHRFHAGMTSFLEESRRRAAVHHRDGEEDARYLIWICSLFFQKGDILAGDVGGDVEKQAIALLQRWHARIVALLTAGQDKILWRLLLQHFHLTPLILQEAAAEYLRNEETARSRCLPQYFQWPSFLRLIVQTHHVDESRQGNKRQRTEEQSMFRSLWNRSSPPSTSWLPLWGYLLSHAYLSQHRDDGVPTENIHQIMDRLQMDIVATLPSSLCISNSNVEKRNALWSGMAACLVDALGEAVVRATGSLKEDAAESRMEPESRGEGCCILGAEVAQIVDLLMVPGLVSALAKNVDCPLAGLVSETADTLLDYSNVHHRLCHETTPSSDDDHDILAQLMAKDALKVLQWMDRVNPRLKRELSDRRFTLQTYNYPEEDPCKHPIVTFLRVLLVAGNLEEGAKLCRAMEDCTGRHKETERCCWYLLFDKMQEEQVLLEHDWDVVRSTMVPVMDRHGNILSVRNMGNLTLANLSIGPFGRTVALEYLHGIVTMAKDELFPGYKTLVATKSVRSLRDADRDKQYLLAIKDAVRRTVLKFLLPRPHSPAEVLEIAARVSEANAPPLLPYPAGGQSAAEVCCWILGEPSLLKIWEEKETRLVEVAVPLPMVRDVGVVAQEESAEEDGVVDMSFEVIPPTPAKTPQKSGPVEAVTESREEIVLGDSEEEEEKAAEESVPQVDEEEHEEDGINVDDEECSDEEEHEAADNVDLNEDEDEEEVAESVDEDEGFPHDNTTNSPESSSVDEGEEENEYYDSNEEYPKEAEANYPRHYQHVSGNYSESDDYDQEDEEETNRRAAFEGEYDDEEGRGSSRSDGSVEVVDIGNSDNEEDEEGDDDEIPVADVVDYESSTEEGRGESEMLNAVVDDYIDAVPEQILQDEQSTEEIMDEAKILHDHVHEFIPVTSPRKSAEKKYGSRAVMVGKNAVPGEEDAEGEEAVACYETEGVEVETTGAMDLEHAPVADGEHDAVSHVDHRPVADAAHSVIENVVTVATKAVYNEAIVTDVNANLAGKTCQREVKPAEDEADKSDAPYSSDGGNLGGELSEDMNADDEHESLDTEDDKRSLAEQGETFDEEEVAGTSGVEDHHGSGDEDLDESFNMDQPSVLVAAAMSSQRQGSSYQEVMTKSYRRASLQSFDNTDAAHAATDANLSEYDEASQDGASSLVENNVLVLAQRHGQDLGLTSVLDEPIDVIDSEDERQEGGQLTDDGYQPDAEVTEEEMVDSKNTRTMDDGYVPDAEATEEENTKPIDRVGPKVIKKRDVRFEAVLETRGTPPKPAPPVKPAANQSIDDGYLPDGALTEEEKRDREERRSRHVEDGYIPDGHTTATDDDSTRGGDRWSSHRRVSLAVAEESIDPGYLPSAVEGTEEERSEEESQEAVSSVLVAAALVTQKDMCQVGDTTKETSSEPSIVVKTKSLSTQSIDEGYLPDGFTEEEQAGPSERVRQRRDVEKGHVPDGHTTPGEATEEDQPGEKPQLLRDMGLHLSESEPAVNDSNQNIPADSTVSSGYLRSEEEGTSTDAKVMSNLYTPDGAMHDKEDESLAMASSAEVTKRQSKLHEDVTGDASDSPIKNLTPSGFRHANQRDDIVAHNVASMNPAIETETHPNPKTQPITKNDLLQPITFNPLTLLDSSSKTELHLTEKTKVNDAFTEIGDPERELNKEGGNLGHKKPARRSTRKTTSETKSFNSHDLHEMGHRAESDSEQEIDESVQSETSSTRRSSRLRAKKVTSSPNVPSSITTGRKGGKEPALPAVPEDENFVEEPVIEDMGLRQNEAADVSPVTSRPRRRGKRSAHDDDGSHASSVDEASVASRTRRRGKRGASDDDDDSSHAVSVDNKATSRTASRSKRVKRVEMEDESRGSDSVASKRVGGRQTKQSQKGDSADESELRDDVTESVSSPAPTTRKGRSNKKGPTVEVDAKGDASESVPSPSSRARRGRPPKKPEPIAAESKDDASASVASPPQTRGARQKQNITDHKTEQVPSPTRSSRRTRKSTQSEGSESIASTRPRRNTRSTKY